MRDIRFRAWDGSKLQLVVAITFDYDEIMLPDRVERYLIKTRIELADGSELVITADEESPIDRYTGLKDWNNQEIWEGDILRTGDKHYSETGEVKMYNGLWGMESKGSFYSITSQTRVEIIGNVYENPELLNESEATE